MDLRPVMDLAGQNLLHCLCPTRNFQPYWSMRVDEECRAGMYWAGNIHNIGRWWDAMLRLEAVTGFVIPAHLEAAMLENLRESFANPDQLCLPAPEVGYMKPGLDLHSLRESLLALTALVRHRNSAWAAAQAHRMLQTLQRIGRPEGGWDLDQLEYYDRNRDESAIPEPNVRTDGRLIEALVWHYEETGDTLALELASRYARYHLEHTVSADGTYNDASRSTHTHSYLGTLRGLLLFGLSTRQRDYVDRVRRTCHVTVPKLVLESGFACHDLWQDRPHRGETGSTGDAMQLALWLALHAGCSEGFDNAERLLRARMVPAQITESPGLAPAADDGCDEHANLEERLVGAIGGMHAEPHGGKRHTTDVTAAGLHGLVDIYNHIVEATDRLVRVNFHLDFQDDTVTIVSRRSAAGAQVSVHVRQRRTVLVRMPGWTPGAAVRLAIDGQSLAPEWIGSSLCIPETLMPGAIQLEYDLPTRRTMERVGDVELEYSWRGDDLVGVHPNTTFFPMYPSTE